MNILCVFNFDGTIVDCDTATHIFKLAPNGEVPRELFKSFDGVNWCPLLNKVFDYLYRNNVRKEDFVKLLQELPFVAGMREFLNELKKNIENAEPNDKNDKSKEVRVQAIMLSDSNNFFIKTFMKHHRLYNLFS